MNHYQKNACVAVRVVGSCLAVYSFLSFFYALVGYAIENVALYAFSAVFYFVVGLVLYFAARPLAALIGRGLD